MYTYFSDRKQRTKISIFYSSWQDILSSIPQSSMLGPLLFHIIFVTCSSLIITLILRAKCYDKLEIQAESLFKWFSDNQMKDNPEKYNLLISSISQSELKIGNATTESITCEKLIRIKNNNKLRLNAHVEDICKKVSRKIHALARVTPIMTVSKEYIPMNAFFT